MTITVNELSLQAINAALLRLQRSIQTEKNNFEQNVAKANATIINNGKNTVVKYDDTSLRQAISKLQEDYRSLKTSVIKNEADIINLEAILSNIDFTYYPDNNEITFVLGDFTKTLTLKDTTYSFSYDSTTNTLSIVDAYTGETVFSEIFNDTTYTFSFTNGVLTAHNNLSGADQTFNFDNRYYTESEIQSLILDKIPSQASASNQLADKEFVNSSIATATATFRGTVTTTQALAALTGDLNDYAFLENIDSTTGQVESYDRYKWVESGGDYGHWKYEYTLNNSSFTAAQWDAINSGITCQIVTDLLDGCYTGHGSQVAKNTANEWKSILATNCNCSSAVDADCIYYNTNVQVNQCCGIIKANCFVGDDQYHAVIPSPNGNTSSYYATIVLDSTCTNAETSMVFNSYTSEYHLLTWYNGTSCLNEIKELWYVDSKYSIDSVGVSTCKANTDCIYIKYCGYRPTVVNSSRKIKCIVYGCTTAPSNVSWTTALKGIFCSRNTTCFGGCTYADACANIRSGLISDIALNVYCGTTCKCTLNKNSSLCLCANAFNENAQISTTTYPGACCTGTLVASDLNDYQKKNIATGIKINNTSNLTCVNTILSCFNNTAPRKAYYIYFGAAHCRYTYLGKIPFGSSNSTGYVSLDMTLYNQSPVGNEFPIRTIHIDMSAGGSSSAFGITGWTDARLDSACTCHPRIVVTKDTSTSFYCLYLDSTYAYVNAKIYLNQERLFTVGDLCAYNAVSGTEVFNSTTCDSIKYIGGLVSIADKAATNESTPILLCTGPTSVGKSSSCSLTFNTCTGVLSTMGTCIGYNRTASCCIEVTPAAQSSCWIYIGAFQPNGTGTATKQYNELSLAFAAIGNGMVSQANVRINAGSALYPVVSIQRGAVYSADTGIDSVVVTRSGSVWNCYLCVWARVKSYGTNKYYFHLFRNMLPDGWNTSLAVCSAYTGTVVAINNATSSTSDGRTQMNVPLVIGNYQTCTSSTTGLAGTGLNKGSIELLGTTPYIDFHRNMYCGDYSARIINDNDRLALTINNGSGCTASTASASFYFCSNGTAILPTSIVGCSGRLLNCILSKTDNSGYPTYRLLYDVTDWYNAAGTSSSNVGGRGLVGTFTHFRCSGYTTTGATQVTATVSYGKGSQADACCISGSIKLTYADIGYAEVSTIPYILKDTTNNKYYIAIRITCSGHNYIFSGCAYSSSGTGFTVNCEICATNANGTLPSGWAITTTGVRCQRANGVYVSCLSTDGLYPLLMGSSENAWATIYSNCSKFKANPNTGRLVSCQSRVNDYILVGNSETTTGVINPTEGGILLCKSQSGKMIQLNGNIGAGVGLFLYHCGDLSGNSYCTLGIEIGAGNVNRGFYHYCAGTFQWLQYWDASKEIHNCPVCFGQCVNGSSSFAGTTAMFNNTNRLGSVYSSSTYSTGYYLLAQICDNGGAGNHDIVLGGYLDGGIYPRMTWKGHIGANKCTLVYACFFVNNALASNCLVATREIDTTTCKLVLRIYGRVSANYQRFNTTITYAAIGDINTRVSPYCSCVTLPGTYVTSVTGTAITTTKNIGAISVDNITVCNASSLTCSFPATSSTYILLGCYSPLNNTLANEIDLGFAIGGGSLVSNTNLKLMLTNAGCCSASQFLQNNIEIKSTNYVTGCYGPRCILFTSNGSSWNCKIGIWAVVCNPASSACSWCFGLLRNRTDDRFSTCLYCQSTAPTGIVCTIDMGTLRNFYFNNARESCFSGVLSTSILCTGSFIPLPTIICGNCNQCYIHLGCYKPDLLCANEVDLTLTVGDAGNNSVNIKALLTTGCINEFYKNNIIVNTASVDRSHAYIDSVVFTTIGTCWSCSIDIYAVVCSTAACTCYSLYNNKQNACFKKCFEALAGLPPAPLKCSIPVNGDSVTALSAPLLASTWKMETNASASFALGCNSYTTLVIGGVNDVRSPTYQKLFISTCITGSENPLNMWIDYMGGYGDKDFITACYSGANCNVIVPMRISSDSQNIYIDLATCTCAARDLCATLYSSCPMPLGSCGNSIRTTCYTACFITDASCAYVYVMCQWPTTITLNVDDPASQFATRILSANTISAYCMATTSDIRQKKDIVPYNNGLCDISKLDIISFRYKNEDSSCIKHISVPANWTNPLLSGEKQNQLRINDAVGILLGAVKDLSKSMTLGQKIKLWLYKKFIEPKNNKKIQKKLEDFN